jgi:putative FmdB family regulatory protein
MPTYEYECTNGHTFEVVQRITADPLKRCKVCRAKATRLISAANFILKGGGWYSDGYSSSKSGGDSASKSSSTESKKESKSESKSSSDKGSSQSSSSD